MTLSDFFSAGALGMSIIAILLSIRADRRSSEKHEYELETKWTAECDLSGEYEIRFRCAGPRRIEHAWINTDSLFGRMYAPHITSIESGSYMSAGDTIGFTLANLDHITELPGEVRIEWRYVQGKYQRALRRLRRLFAPPGYSEETHFENVDLSSVLHALRLESEEQSTMQTGTSHR